MRLLYITCANTAGGSNVSLLHLIAGMKAHGHECIVVTVPGHGYLIDRLKEIGCPYHQIPMCYNVYPKGHNPLLYLPRLLRMLYVYLPARKKMRNIVEAVHPDIVHTNIGPLALGYRACKTLHIPHVWHHREYQDLDFGYHYFPSVATFLDQTRADTNYNIAITQGIFDYRQFRRGHDKVVYNGIVSESDNHAIKEKDDYILFAGRIEETKGAYNVISAYSHIVNDHPTTRLLLAGNHSSNAYYKRCVDFINAHNLQAHVSFLGDRRDITDLMASARMIVVPSRFEGFGRITAEAMAMGCPVVGRNTAGTKEQFDKGLEYTGQEIGLRFNTDEELLDQMRFALTHDCTAMTERAQRTVFHFYTDEEYVRRIETLYNEILLHHIS